MPTTPTRTALACLLAAGAFAYNAGAVMAAGDDKRIHIVFPGPGTPIQDAVNGARPGDTIIVRPGRYREAVAVTKPLTIIGSGRDSNGSLLTPPAQPSGDACGGTSGFCIAASPGTAGPVRDVTVKNFEVRGFAGSGVIGVNTQRLTVKHIEAAGNEEYGIASFLGQKTVIASSTATGAEEAGLYIGDSPDAQSQITGNKAFANGDGILVRDSTGVEIARNTTQDNCAGILTASTRGASSGGLDIHHNTADRNTRACPALEEAPERSGLGIAIAGSHDVRVRHNYVRGNRPTGPTGAAGGIVVVSTAALGGADPENVRVTRNTALNNQPADLVWDLTGTGIVFSDNRNRTSLPPGLD
ncbi:right-handed parallel beta-helix repeat-containing protein [Streptomyces sp. NPDC096030]|uniref:right-handed parallel beta-helix repeat-containing protein n=1 Tax=Streptomyces sp. NPDC096030 TaxID=3155423 RepID=UPI003316648F